MFQYKGLSGKMRYGVKCEIVMIFLLHMFFI